MDSRDTLQRIVEAFIATYGGALRLREIKILLLIRQGTATGRGFSISELARASGTPLESVRRQVRQLRDEGRVRKRPDPNDRRVNRYFATDAMAQAWPAEALQEALRPILHESGAAPADAGPTLAGLLALLDVLIDGYLGSIRIRGARMALLVYQATLAGNGVAISELAAGHDAPLETARRVLAQHVAMGHIRFVEDPEDDRKTLVVSADLGVEQARIEAMSRRLARLQRSRADADHGGTAC